MQNPMMDVVATAMWRRCRAVRCVARYNQSAKSKPTAGTTNPLSLLMSASTENAACDHSQRVDYTKQPGVRRFRVGSRNG